MRNFFIQKKHWNLGSMADLNNFLPGKLALIVGGSGDHNYGPRGNKFVISDDVQIGPSSMNNAIPGGNHITFRDFRIIQESRSDLVALRESLSDQIHSMKSEMQNIQDKINFLDEVGQDTFDPVRYNVSKALEYIDTVEDKKERTQLITNLIFNETQISS